MIVELTIVSIQRVWNNSDSLTFLNKCIPLSLKTNTMSLKSTKGLGHHPRGCHPWYKTTANIRESAAASLQEDRNTEGGHWPAKCMNMTPTWKSSRLKLMIIFILGQRGVSTIIPSFNLSV